MSKGLKSADLPTLEQFSAWMKNQKRTPVSQQQRQSDAGVTVAPTVAALSDWPRSGETVDALYLLEGVVHVSEQRVFVAYTCRGMLATLRRYVGDVVHLAVDAKMKVLTGGMGVATLSRLVKDGLRNTNLCHQETGRVQGRARTTHAMPFLQATMHQESEQNYASLFEAAEALWKECCPERPPLQQCVRQLHKDFAPGIEAARRVAFPQSRPCNDWFHLKRKRAEIAARCKQVKHVNGKFEKLNASWVMSCLEHLRLTPAKALMIELWAAFLLRLRALKEEAVAAWLRQHYTSTAQLHFGWALLECILAQAVGTSPQRQCTQLGSANWKRWGAKATLSLA